MTIGNILPIYFLTLWPTRQQYIGNTFKEILWNVACNISAVYRSVEPKKNVCLYYFVHIYYFKFSIHLKLISCISQKKNQDVQGKNKKKLEKKRRFHIKKPKQCFRIKESKKL